MQVLLPAGRHFAALEVGPKAVHKSAFQNLHPVSEDGEHGARMKETNVEYCPLHAHTASVAPGFEMRSKCRCTISACCTELRVAVKLLYVCAGEGPAPPSFERSDRCPRRLAKGHALYETSSDVF